MAEEKAQKEKARAEAKASGRRRRSRKKTKYFDAVEDGAFGVKKKDHIDRIELPPLDQLELVSMTEEAVEDEQVDPQNQGGGEP